MVASTPSALGGAACAGSAARMMHRAVAEALRTASLRPMFDATRPPEFADVEAAAARIAPHAVLTPLFESRALNDRLGARVFLKPESLQRTGSFKFRGAYNRISLIPESERGGGVVAFSSGN